jgi:DNA polymerase
VQVLTLDFETYYDTKSFTLRKLTTEEYVRSPLFEPLLLAYRLPNGATGWVGQEEIPAFLACWDWAQTAIVAHHAQFDGLILAHYYGVRPCLWLDTLSMGRMIHGNGLRLGLDKLAQHYGLGAKSIDYDSFAGRRWCNLTPMMRSDLGKGAMHDCELTFELFKRLRPQFPPSEYPVVDMTVRQFTEPAFIGDTALLEHIKLDEWTRKADALYDLGLTASDLQSADRFVAELEALGVEVEYKPGKTGPIPAIAKTDDFMKALVEHDDDSVALLAQARLDVRSTIDETRAGRLAGMSTRGAMPVYLQYCGAHTNRWSGGDKVNWQNFRSRGGAARLGGAICAPRGHKVVKADASQIECRMLNYVAGQWDVIENFRQKADPYIGIASKAYGRPISKADKLERGTGKQLELSCGYGAGGYTIRVTAARGTYGPPVQIDDETALRWRNIYRDTHPGVVNLWKQGDQVLNFMGGQDPQEPVQWGPAVVHARGGGTGRIILPIDPNGFGPFMDYTLEWDVAEGAWRRKTRKGWVRIWGGHLVENLIQWLSRQHTAQAAVRLSARWKVALTKHDEIVLVVPDAEAQEAYDAALRELSVEPAWMPGLPLDAEGATGDRYGD